MSAAQLLLLLLLPPPPPPPTPTPLTNFLTAGVVVAATTELLVAIRGNTLNTALSTKPRAELINVIITRASELAGPENDANWTTLRGAFLHLAKLQPTDAAAAPASS